MGPEDALKQSEKTLSAFLSKNKFKNNEAVVLEKNENSFLVPVCKEPAKEYFQKIFSPEGPFWGMHKELKIGDIPKGKQYAIFVADQLYFCQNIEEGFFRTVGLKRELAVEDNALTRKRIISAGNAIKAIMAPAEIIAQSRQNKINEEKVNRLILNFEKDNAKSKEYFRKNVGKKSFDAKDAAQALEGAAKMVRYGFLFSTASYLKLKQTNPAHETINETRQLIHAARIGEVKNISEAGFLGEDIYDISKPRIFDSPSKPLLISEVPNEEWAGLREAAKLAGARYFAIQRKAYLFLGKKAELEERIFYLTTKELSKLKTGKKQLLKIAEERERTWKENEKTLLPKRILYSGKWFFEESGEQKQLSGVSAGAKTTVSGPASLVKSESDMKKNFSGKIIVTNYFSPNLVTTYNGALGIVSSVGGALSHPAIVAREKNLPCIVQVSSIESIKEGDFVEVDGKTGKVKLK